MMKPTRNQRIIERRIDRYVREWPESEERGDWYCPIILTQCFGCDCENCKDYKKFVEFYKDKFFENKS